MTAKSSFLLHQLQIQTYFRRRCRGKRGIAFLFMSQVQKWSTKNRALKQRIFFGYWSETAFIGWYYLTWCNGMPTHRTLAESWKTQKSRKVTISTLRKQPITSSDTTAGVCPSVLSYDPLGWSQQNSAEYKLPWSPLHSDTGSDFQLSKKQRKYFKAKGNLSQVNQYACCESRTNISSHLNKKSISWKNIF